MATSIDVIERELALLTVDLTGFTRAAQSTRAVDLAAFLDTYYRLCALVVTRHHGRIVKFMGDACFAVFSPEHCVDAVDCALDMQREVSALPRIFGSRPPSVGANVHLATVADGEVGAEHDRRYDVFGEGVNHLFRMGGGAAVRISEPVYRSLPNDRRGPWKKNRPPATYVLDA
jgi:adenylate cyclase